VREGTLKFLNRCLSTTRIAPNKPDLKPYSEALVELLGDSQGSIRNAAQEGLALFMKIFGERMLNPYLEPVDDLKKGKVKEALEKVTVKCKAGSAPAPAPPKPASGPPKVWRSPFCESCSTDMTPLLEQRAPAKIPDIPLEDEGKPPKPPAKPPARLLVSNRYRVRSKGLIVRSL